MKILKLIVNILIFILFFSSYIQANGNLFISNKSTPRNCVICDLKGTFIDPNLTIGCTTTNDILVYSGNLNETTFPGGRIYITIDSINDPSIWESLDCTPADQAITSSYSAANRMLTLTIPASTSYSIIQDTLRSVVYIIKAGQSTRLRKVRIWVETAGYKFVNSRNGRIYALGSKLTTGATSYTWAAAFSDFANQAPRFGVFPYFSSITSLEEQTAAATYSLNGYQSWIGALATLTGGNAYPATWNWVMGPDTNVAFYLSTGETAGNAINGLFNFWTDSGFRPNFVLSQSAIHADMLNVGGYTRGGVQNSWNNPNGLNAVLNGFSVEYGGQTSDNNTIIIQPILQNALLFNRPI